MPAPQFNKVGHPNRWYSLTYQSNNLLNVIEHNKVKRILAGYLVGNFNVIEIHSYIHGNIIFAVRTNRPIGIFDEIINKIRGTLSNHAPPLLFSLVLVARTNETQINYMYVYGSDVMDTNFLTSIDDFYP